MLQIQSSSRGEQKFFIFVLKKYWQISAVFTDTDTTSQYHKNRPIPPIPIPILKYWYITIFITTNYHHIILEKIDLFSAALPYS